jgi:hypothetical protein
MAPLLQSATTPSQGPAIVTVRVTSTRPLPRSSGSTSVT